MLRSIFNRFRHIYVIAIRPIWTLFVLGLVSMISLAAFVRDEFLSRDQSERYKLLNMLPDWPWEAWAIIFLVGIIFVVLEGSYRLSAVQQNKINNLTARNRKLSEDYAVRAIARFNSNGMQLANCTNIANISKMDALGDATSVFNYQFFKSMDRTYTICTTMTGTPNYSRFDLNAAGNAATVVFNGALTDEMGLIFEEFKPKW